MAQKNRLSEFLKKLDSSKAKVGVIGLGYVGLPLVLRFCEEGFSVTGFDVDVEKVSSLIKGRSYIKHIPSSSIKEAVLRGLLKATSDMSKLKDMDAIIICVPTPLTSMREPDMSYVVGTANEIAKFIRPGQLVSLESTTYPGTTDELLVPRFEKNGLKAGKDFFLVFSPEREDPGRTDHSTKTIPKVVGGVTKNCLKAGVALYSKVVDTVVPVSSTRVSEMTKLLENIYRCVNIALVNELKMLADRMGMDIRDFIELCGEITPSMPYYVVGKTADALNSKGVAIKGSRILILGAAYKKDVDDMRESPAVHVIELLRAQGAEVDYHDPYVSKLPKLRGHTLNMRSVRLDKKAIKKYACVVIVTAHSCFDYKWLARESRLLVDSRGAVKGINAKNIVRA